MKKQKRDPVLDVMLKDSNVNIGLYEYKELAPGMCAILDNGRFGGGYRLNVDTSIWQIVGNVGDVINTKYGVSILTTISTSNMVNKSWLTNNFRPIRKGLKLYPRPRLFKAVSVFVRVKKHSGW